MLQLLLNFEPVVNKVVYFYLFLEKKMLRKQSIDLLVRIINDRHYELLRSN